MKRESKRESKINVGGDSYQYPGFDLLTKKKTERGLWGRSRQMKGKEAGDL